MATKKPASSVKKSSVKKPTPKTTKTTNVTTVKAVSASKPAKKLSGFKLSRAPLLGAGIAEFIGTFLLAAVVIAAQGSPLVVGFAVVAISLAVGALSGAHLNPLVTVGAWATRKIAGVRALVYVVAQVLGAMLALVLLGYFVGQAPEVSAQAQMYGQTAAQLFTTADLPSGKEFAVFLAEFTGAIIFGFAVASALKLRDRLASATAVGLGLFVALMVSAYAASLVSASTVINPAVAVALQAIDFKSVWPFAIYVFGSLLGGVVGFVLNDLVQVESDNVA